MFFKLDKPRNKLQPNLLMFIFKAICSLSFQSPPLRNFLYHFLKFNKTAIDYQDLQKAKKYLTTSIKYSSYQANLQIREKTVTTLKSKLTKYVKQ